jgi:hypothetical protein
MILCLPAMLFIAINILDITTRTGLICFGIYGFIVENKFQPIRTQQYQE